MKTLKTKYTTIVATLLAGSAVLIDAPLHAEGTTAWSDGKMQIDGAALASRSNLIYKVAPTRERDFAPLGNGKVGAAVWAGDGFTAQMNDLDIILLARSSGRLVIPGLSAMTTASDYKGVLDFSKGRFVQTGGGIKAVTYVDSARKNLIVEVTGVAPGSAHSAKIMLWSGRHPTITVDAANKLVGYSETFTDNNNTSFKQGIITALKVSDGAATFSKVDDLTGKVDFVADANGSYRVQFSVGTWDGVNAASALVNLASNTDALSGSTVADATQAYWTNFWNSIAKVRLTSSANNKTPGDAEYLENIRTINLFISQATGLGTYPMSQGGRSRGVHPLPEHSQQWNYYVNGDWHFNQRQNYDVFAGAGMSHLMKPYFDWYLRIYDKLKANTVTKFPYASGICVTDNNRYDGLMNYVESASNVLTTSPRPNPDVRYCDPTSAWYTTRQYNAGPEVAVNIIHTAKVTNNPALIRDNYNFLKDVGLFFMTYPNLDANGKLKFDRASSFENYFDAVNPMPVVAAAYGYFPLLRSVAVEMGDTALVTSLDAAIAKLPPLPTTTRNGKTVLAWQESSTGTNQNFQNPEMEAVWPWGLFGDDPTTNTIAVNSYKNQVYTNLYDWNADSTWAARLGLRDSVKSSLASSVSSHTAGASGTDGFGGPAQVEALGNMTMGIQESIVQYYDGVLKIAPAIPYDWDAQGAVYIEGGHLVSVEAKSGLPTLATINAGSDGNITIRNPWPGKPWAVRNGDGSSIIVSGASAANSTVVLPVARGQSYIIENALNPYSSMTKVNIVDTAATSPKAFNGNALGSFTNAAPVAVTELAGSVTGSGAVTLTWKNNTVEGSSIQIWRTGDLIATIPGNTQTYVDTKFTAGQWASGYQNYQFRTISPNGKYADSSPVTVTLGYTGGAVGFVGSSSEPGVVNLSWSNSATGASGIQVWRQGQLVTTLPGTATSYTDSAIPGDLRTAGSANYMLTVVYPSGSNVNSQKLTVEIVSGAPANLAGRALAPRLVALSWYNTGVATSIEVWRSGYLMITLPGNSTSFVDSLPETFPLLANNSANYQLRVIYPNGYVDTKVINVSGL